MPCPVQQFREETGYGSRGYGLKIFGTNTISNKTGCSIVTTCLAATGALSFMTDNRVDKDKSSTSTTFEGRWLLMRCKCSQKGRTPKSQNLTIENLNLTPPDSSRGSDFHPPPPTPELHRAQVTGGQTCTN